MSESFSEVFRPKKPNQLIGQTQVKIATTLMENVAKGKVIQEVLFSGESGIGKTTIAKMYINAVVGFEYDLSPYNCADKTGVSYIRDEVIGTMPYMPLDANYRVYFLDEIHKLSEEAQNALLVAIEPVPKHVLLIACTTQPEKLIPTLRSRLTEFHLMPPSITDFQKLGSWISKKTEKTVDFNTRDQVINLAGGNVRQFVRYYQQALDGAFTPDDVEKAPGVDLVKLIINGKPNLQSWFKGVDDSTDYVKTSMGMVGYAIAMIKNGNASKQAMAVIKHFGDNPSKTIVDKYTFFNRLLATFEEVTH